MKSVSILIPTSAEHSLRVAFNKIVKAAVRMELPVNTQGFMPDYASRREVMKTRIVIDGDSHRSEKYAVEVMDVMLELPEVGAQAGDWIVVARVNKVVGDAADGQNDVFSVDADVAAQFRSAAITCEHCNVNRYRVRSVVCVNVVAGQMKQVGHECATFYVGNAERAIDGLAFQELVQVLLAPFSDEDGPQWGGRGGRVAMAHDAQEVVARAIRAIRDHGWVPSKDENGERNPDATWFRVNGELNTRADQPSFVPVLDSDTVAAAEMISWVRGVRLGGTDEYLPALQALFSPEWVSSRRMGLAVSLVRAFERAKVEQAKIDNPPTEPAPEGRVQVTGTIQKFKSVPGWTYDSWVEKMIVELPSRARVWLSVPAFLVAPKVGDAITFVATFERSKDDQFFAFGSRPAAPKAPKKPRAKKGEKVADPLAPGGEYVAK